EGKVAGIVTRNDNNPSAKAFYSETTDPFLTVVLPTAVADLDAGRMPRSLRDAFAASEEKLSDEGLPERSSGVVVVPITPGSRWRAVAMPKVDPDRSEKLTFGDEYIISADATGTLQVSELWRDIKYRTGQGNFPLWESETLRDKAFRKLF